MHAELCKNIPVFIQYFEIIVFLNLERQGISEKLSQRINTRKQSHKLVVPENWNPHLKRVTSLDCLKDIRVYRLPCLPGGLGSTSGSRQGNAKTDYLSVALQGSYILND